jgi:protein-disulfide isomerase
VHRKYGNRWSEHAMRSRSWAGFCLIIGMLWGLSGAELRAADGATSSELPAEQIERIVREYLLREPEIIYEALQELQRRQTAAAAERQQAAIRANHDALYADPDAPVGGNPDAGVTLVEFFDYRCTYCRRVVDSMRTLLDTNTDLRVVFKELPILGEDSVRASRAALASKKQNGYVPFHFALMTSQDLSLGAIRRMAADLGMDPDRLEADMVSPEVSQEIEANMRLAGELGIEGTPAFVIDDQLIPGAVDLARLEALIDYARANCATC